MSPEFLDLKNPIRLGELGRLGAACSNYFVTDAKPAKTLPEIFRIFSFQSMSLEAACDWLS
jgi:hypothetical protein